MPFCKRLREYRIKSKYTQQAMADSLGITLRGYQFYEQGVSEPSISTLVMIANMLDVSLDILLCRDEYESGSK